MTERPITYAREYATMDLTKVRMESRDIRKREPCTWCRALYVRRTIMLSGVQYNVPLDLEAIADGGFSYAEIPYEVIEKGELPVYRKEKGDQRILRVSGFTYPLQQLSCDKLYEMLEACKRFQGNYIVLETMNCDPGILEVIVEECAMMLTDYGIPLFLENGCKGDDVCGYLHNTYSDAANLIKISDYCNRLCERPMIGICYNVGYGNLLAQNIPSQIHQCREYLCMIHANDNGGTKNEKQMPYTFTKGRGDLVTDWYHIIGELIRMDFQGWMIFDTIGLFARCPKVLQTSFMRIQCALVREWESQYTFAERVLGKPDKKLILFGAGQMLVDYMREFGEKYPPYFAVDNGQARWGTEYMGVPIKHPKEILQVPEEERNVVICCMYYDAIGAQLREMGVEYEEFHDRYYV